MLVSLAAANRSACRRLLLVSWHFGSTGPLLDFGGWGPTGSPETCLVVVRGNSGCGKSSTALAVRSHLGRTCALAQQDLVRRTVLIDQNVGCSTLFVSGPSR
jgi:hypothetical protein